MAKKSYWEKLKDPRWQKKRLEALAKADFACEYCYDHDSTLHVHHKQYFKGREPWEYDVKQLAVLCEACHTDHHASEDRLSLSCSFLGLDGPCSRDSVASLIEGFTSSNTAEPSDKVAYCAGMIAANALANYGVQLNDLIKLALLSESHGKDMLDVLLAFAASKAGEGKQ